jgi:lycopene cyclase domain-containing protein
MTPLYFYILLFSIAVPLLYTIIFKDFIKYWKLFTISTVVVALIFLLWDYYFTAIGVWSFNYDYCLGIELLGMPLEEWLFFLIIPFCSLFIHYCAITVNPNFKFNKKASFYLTITLIVLVFTVAITNSTKYYTAVNFFVLAMVLSLGLLFFRTYLQEFYASFIVILIPFFIVNGILTGSFIETPIVNYNNLENLGIRLFTIPVEDIGYAFSMLFGNLMIFETLKKRLHKTT